MIIGRAEDKTSAVHAAARTAGHASSADLLVQHITGHTRRGRKTWPSVGPGPAGVLSDPSVHSPSSVCEHCPVRSSLRAGVLGGTPGRPIRRALNKQPMILNGR